MDRLEFGHCRTLKHLSEPFYRKKGGGLTWIFIDLLAVPEKKIIHKIFLLTDLSYPYILF
jgi:hypothetical protein